MPMRPKDPLDKVYGDVNHRVLQPSEYWKLKVEEMMMEAQGQSDRGRMIEEYNNNQGDPIDPFDPNADNTQDIRYEPIIRQEMVHHRNMPYVKEGVTPKDYSTYLPAEEEQQFREWVKQNNVPYDMKNEGHQDYDMRGYYQELQSGGPNASTGLNPNDHQLHYNDYFKTPYHQSFSNESKFANPDTAPHWEGDRLIAPDGTVIFDETKK